MVAREKNTLKQTKIKIEISKLVDTAKAGMRRKFIALGTYIRGKLSDLEPRRRTK